MEKTVAINKQSLRKLSKNELINIIFGLLNKINALEQTNNTEPEVEVKESE